MPTSGTFQNVQIDRIVYGRPATAVLAEEATRLGATRVFLMVSRTLNSETSWVEDMRAALGNRYAGTFDGMPSHTPREAVLAATAQARTAKADLIVTFVTN
jgi:maleylacetate reductase